MYEYMQYMSVKVNKGQQHPLHNKDLKGTHHYYCANMPVLMKRLPKAETTEESSGTLRSEAR